MRKTGGNRNYGACDSRKSLFLPIVISPSASEKRLQKNFYRAGMRSSEWSFSRRGKNGAQRSGDERSRSLGANHERNAFTEMGGGGRNCGVGVFYNRRQPLHDRAGSSHRQRRGSKIEFYLVK